jgi:hypothetical protein
MTFLRYKYVALVLAAFLCLSPFASLAFAQVAINFIAVNASETEAKEVDVKYYLPEELQPDDILNTGELDLGYDVDKGMYFVYKTMKFDLKESRTFKVLVKDVWRIEEEEINVLKNQVDENLKLLEGSESYQYAVKAREHIHQEIDYIFNQQKNYSDNIDRRIEEYRAFKAELETVRNNAYDLDYLEHESRALDEMEKSKLIKFIIEVENPQEEKKKIQHKHYLPEEVRADDVVEKRDFEVRFDDKKKRSFLTKDEEFNPGEKKKYEILIKDIWDFPINKADALQVRADLAVRELKDTIYEQSANYLFKIIQTRINEIKTSKLLEQPIEQHIGTYRLDEKRYEETKKDVERLEKMMSIVRAKKLREMEVGKVQNVLQRLKALRGLAALSEAIFKRGISVTMTWKIVFGTIIFVAMFTTIHFVIWARRSGKMGEEIGLKRGEEIRVVPKPGEEERAE